MRLLFTSLFIFIISSSKLFSQAPDWQWAKSAGSTAIDMSYDISCDEDGNVYIIGQGASPIIFDNLTLSISNSFIAKYSSLGKILWVKTINSYEIGLGIALCVKNNYLFVAGGYSGDTVVFGNDTLIGKGICIFKYDLDGNLISTLNAGTADYIDGYGSVSIEKLTCDNTGNIYVLGGFDGISDTTYLSIGNTILKSRGNGEDVFISKYDFSGNALWAKKASGIQEDWGKDIALDINGNVYITGYFMGISMIFDTDTLFNGNQTGFGSPYDLFFAKYNSSGNLDWAKSIGGLGDEQGTGITIDLVNNIYLGGFFTSDNINIGSTTLDTADGYSFLVKWDSLGNVLWAKNHEIKVKHIIADSSNNLLGTGLFSGTITMGSSILTALSGSSDVLIAKYDSSGNVLWATNARGTGYEDVYAIATDVFGNTVITGDYRGSMIVFGNDTLINISDPPFMAWGDIFTAKIPGSISQINEIANNNSILISPNPSNDKIFVEIPLDS